jgi:hypothetical protein
VSTRPRGLQSSGFCSEEHSVLFDLECVLIGLDGELSGASISNVVAFRSGEGEAGDSGRRNGDVLGELKDSGEGLYVAGADCKKVSTNVQVQWVQ